MVLSVFKCSGLYVFERIDQQYVLTHPRADACAGEAFNLASEAQSDDNCGTLFVSFCVIADKVCSSWGCVLVLVLALVLALVLVC